MTDTITTNDQAVIIDKAAVVGELYAAFGRGDVPAILDRLANDVSWDGDWADNYAQREGRIEHFLPRRGHAQVAEFFAVVADQKIEEFTVQRLLVGDDAVVAQVVLQATLPGGGRVRDEELHLWRFDGDGKIVALRHYIDTAKHLAAADGVDTIIR
jgi:uncharacterized protein